MQATSKFLIAIALSAVFASWVQAADATSTDADNPAVSVGQPVAEFTFKDIRYLPRKLADFGEKKAYVIMFATLDCPIAKKYLPKLKALDEAYRDQGVQFLAVNVGPSDDLREVAYQALVIDAEFPFAKDF